MKIKPQVKTDKVTYVAIAKADYSHTPKTGESVEISKGDKVFGIRTFSEKKSEFFFKVVTIYAETFPIKEETFLENFDLLNIFNDQELDELNDSIEKQYVQQIYDLKEQLPKESSKKNMNDLQPTHPSITGLFSSIVHNSFAKKSIDLRVLIVGEILKGTITIDELIPIQITGKPESIDNDLLNGIIELYKENAMIISDIENYKFQLENLKEEKRKALESEKKAATPKDTKATKSVKSNSKQTVKPVESKEEQVPIDDDEETDAKTDVDNLDEEAKSLIEDDDLF